MRRSTSRTLVCLLLALTLPIQAIAAVAADVCMTVGHQPHAASHAAEHSHDGSADGHHGDEPSDKTSGNAHCPPCAACCATTAISSSILTLLPDGPTAAHVAARLLSFYGIQPDRLDRPPLAL
jgi:hypothetical protein